MHNFSLLTDALGRRTRSSRASSQNSNAVFATLAEPGRRAAGDRCNKLPTALKTTQTRRSSRSRGWPTSSGRRSRRLRPAARALGPSLRETRPFLRQSTPIIRDEIRPFTRAALPTVKQLRPAMRDLAAATPDLTASFKVVN